MSPSTRRAWIEILRRREHIGNLLRSPSTRRAWIEIPVLQVFVRFVQSVALHPEGVDRNSIYEVLPAILELSPSTRRAWIEISVAP